MFGWVETLNTGGTSPYLNLDSVQTIKIYDTRKQLKGVHKMFWEVDQKMFWERLNSEDDDQILLFKII